MTESVIATCVAMFLFFVWVCWTDKSIIDNKKKQNRRAVGPDSQKPTDVDAKQRYHVYMNGILVGTGDATPIKCMMPLSMKAQEYYISYKGCPVIHRRYENYLVCGDTVTINFNHCDFKEMVVRSEEFSLVLEKDTNWHLEE